jgi:L-amino acid N-acyltransferase YncA
MDIRLARPGDADALRAIYNVEVSGSTVTFDIEPRSHAQQVAWIERHQGVHPAVVAVDQGVVAGFGSLSPFRERAAYSTTVEDSVYVAGDRRGQGVGRLLLEELINLATRQGFHTVMARTAGDNHPSIELHRACGFVDVGIEREVGRKFGRWIDVAILQRML